MAYGPPSPYPDSVVWDKPRSIATGKETKMATTNHTQDIANHLRVIDTVDNGRAYLDTLKLDKATLLEVATELYLTRVDRLSRKALIERVLKQAIGARNKFAGLRNW